MTHPSRRTGGRHLHLLLAVGLGACASGLPNVEAVDVPRLEQAVAASPEDTDLQVQLGLVKAYAQGECRCAPKSRQQKFASIHFFVLISSRFYALTTT